MEVDPSDVDTHSASEQANHAFSSKEQARDAVKAETARDRIGQRNYQGELNMRLSTSLSILVSVCLLTACGGGGGGGTAPLDIPVKLKCSGSNDVHVGHKAGTVTFSVPDSCAPLKTITPDPPGDGFTKKAGPSGTFSYTYDGRQLPSGGYSFSYSATDAGHGLASNGSGVIKN